MTTSRPQSIASAETKNNGMRRIAAIITFFLTFAIIGLEVHAHNPHDPVVGLGISPNFANDHTLFVATESELTDWRYMDILRSTDSGATWVKLPKGMDNWSTYSAIRVSPNYSIDRTVFAATNGDGVYQSSNRGNSWRPINTGLLSLNIKELKIAKLGSTDYVLFLISGSDVLYRRTSTQTSWSKVRGPSTAATETSKIAVSPDFTLDTTVMTAEPSGKLQISIDGGFNWVDKGNPTGATVYDLAIAPGGAKEIFLATSSGIFYSDDSGNTFTKKPGNLPIEEINNIAVSPNYLIDHTVFCTTLTKSVYKSTNSGNSWTLHESGAAITHQTAASNEFSELQVSNTFSTDQAIFLSAYDGIFISTNGGIDWTQSQTRKNLITGLALSPHFKDDQRAIATTYSGGGIYTSADSGFSWSLGSTGWPPIAAMSAFDVHFVQNGAIPPKAVATQNHSNLGFSNNYGASWNVLPIPQFPDIAKGAVYVNVFALSPIFDSDKEIYLGTRTHGVLQTVNGGITWRNRRGVPESSNITSLAVSPNYASDQTAFAANRAGEIWRTKNGGNSWSQVGAGSMVLRGWPEQRYMWIAISPQFATDQLVLVGTTNGVYRSTNGGDDWKPILNSNIGALNVIQQIEFSPTFGQDRTIFVMARGKGLFRVSLNSTAGVTSLQNIGLSLLKQKIQFTEFRVSPNFEQDATLLGASRESVYISRDGGSTWIATGHPEL